MFVAQGLGRVQPDARGTRAVNAVTKRKIGDIFDLISMPPLGDYLVERSRTARLFLANKAHIIVLAGFQSGLPDHILSQRWTIEFCDCDGPGREHQQRALI
jgi:hypothetical protein